MSADDFLKDVYGDAPEPGVYLAGLRYRENLTQEQLGEIVGVAPSKISAMECGIRPIGKNIAKRLADLFKADYRLFF